MNSSTSDLKPYLKKYFYGLSFIIIFIISSFFYIEINHNKEDKLAEIINKSGKQRMLSQRISLFANNYHDTFDSNVLIQYEDLIEKMQEDNIYIQEKSTNPEIREYYKKNPNLNAKVEEFIKLNKNFLKDPSRKNLDLIVNYQNNLLKLLDNAVYLHEYLLEQENNEFEQLIIIVLLLIILIISLEAVLVYIPLIKRVLNSSKKIEVQKEKFKAILENATDGIHILDKDGNVILCSNSFAHMLGYSIEEVMQLNIKDWNATNEVLDSDYVVKKMSKENTYQTIHKRKDGSTFYVQASVKPITLDENDYYYASSRNINELIEEKEKTQAALEAAQAAEEEALSIQDELYVTQDNLIDLNLNLENKINEATKDLTHSFEVINKYLITSKTDLKGNITEVSDKFCEISKYSREELIGKNHRLVKHPDMPKEIYKELWQTISSGKEWNGRIKNKAKDGSAYWADSSISPLYDINGTHIGYFSYKVDVTNEILNIEIQEKHNNELESKLKEQIEELRVKDIQMFEQAKLASMGEMMSNISHQWRQPLNLISISNGSVKYGIQYDNIYSKEEILNYIEDIDSSCQFLSKTIETFSNFLNQNKEYKLCSIENEINSVKFIIEPSLKALNIELLDNIDYSEEHKCKMVENELSQVVINILTNAKDALIERNIDNKKIIEINSIIKNDKYTITIEDNAGGISEDIKDKIFEPYFTTKFKSQGTGLGLSMSYDIMKKSMKGNLYVQNTNKGAKFFIEVPL